LGGQRKELDMGALQESGGRAGVAVAESFRMVKEWNGEGAMSRRGEAAGLAVARVSSEDA
jgi:hypothetical protein